jgi:hypothetical protein
MKWDEQSFDNRRLSGQRWKDPLCHVHELSRVAVDCRATGTCVSWHRRVNTVTKYTRQSFPAKYLLPILFIEQADTGGVRAAET